MASTTAAAAFCGPVGLISRRSARASSSSPAAAPRQPAPERSGGAGAVSRREAALQLLLGRAALAAIPAFDLASSRGAAAAAAAPPLQTRVEPAGSGPRKFHDLDGSGGVTALEIREGTGATPRAGDKVAIHYYARLAAKQGWRFDSSYEHKDQSGAPEPFEFVIGDGVVIAGLDAAVRTMREGGVRRVVIPPSQGYQNRVQGPIPPNFSDRQRLYTTIFNPTRLANGEGSTLGTLVFDIELLGIRTTRS